MDNPASIFADTIYTIGSYANLSANECERFGMTWGCKPIALYMNVGSVKYRQIIRYSLKISMMK